MRKNIWELGRQGRIICVYRKQERNSSSLLTAQIIGKFKSRSRNCPHRDPYQSEHAQMWITECVRATGVGCLGKGEFYLKIIPRLCQEHKMN